MKRVLTIAAALVVLAVPAFAQQQYGWKISNSATNPDLNSGATQGAPLPLYLWLDCASPDGMSAAEFDLSLPAGMFNFGFTPLNGFLNAGGAGDPLLAVGGCPQGPIVAGVWNLFGSTPGVICLVNSARSGWAVTVDCASPVPSNWPIKRVGYGYGVPNDSCNQGPLLCVVSVEPSSWGSVKSLYR